MRIPRWLRNQKVEVEVFMGRGAYGPIYDEVKVEEWVRFEPSTKLIRTPEGEEVVAAAKAWFPETSKIKQQDRVTFNERTYEVSTATPQYGKYKISHVEVYLT